MTAVMSRTEKGKREKGEPQRDHRRKRVAPGCRLFLAVFSTLCVVRYSKLEPFFFCA